MRPRDAEGGVGTGIAEVPGELDAGDSDLERGEAGSDITRGGPEALCLNGEGGEEDGEYEEWKVLDEPEIFPGWACVWTARPMSRMRCASASRARTIQRLSSS